MKTIRLTEEAYARLLSWKTGPHDSFSKVVERVVPKRGAMSAVLEAARGLPALPEDVMIRLEKESKDELPGRRRGSHGLP